MGGVAAAAPNGQRAPHAAEPLRGPATREKLPITLGFVTARPAFLTGDGIYTDAGTGRLVDALSARVEAVHVVQNTAPERAPLHDHRLDLPRARFHALPHLPSLVRGLPKAVPCARTIAAVERQSDGMIVQLPFASPLALAMPRGPRVYQVCADIRGVAAHSPAYRGPRAVPARSLAEGIAWLQHALVLPSNARAVTNGRELLDGLPAGKARAVVSSALRADDLGTVRRQRSTDRFRILFVGYLRPEKGVDVLLPAFERFRERVGHAELVVVGPGERSRSRDDAALERRIAHLEREGALRFLGHLGFGPELFQAYADADVLVLPSRSEGTPRVLVEARAFGCPVVASRVGGVPTSVEDDIDGLLVTPGDEAELADAMLRVALEPGLRARLVEAGYARARRCTVDALAETLLDELRAVLA